MSNINDLHNLFQKLNPNNFIREHNWKVLQFLDILIKKQNGHIISHLSQTRITSNDTAVLKGITGKST